MTPIASVHPAHSALPGDARRVRSEWSLGWRHLRRNHLAMIGLVVVVFLAAVALAGPDLPLPNPLTQHMGLQAAPPSAQHWLGTDSLGRDVLSRLVGGARASLSIAVGAVLVAVSLGVPLGLVAGYFGAWADVAIMRWMDAMLSFPALVLAIALVASLGAGPGSVLVAIGFVNIPVFARLTRGAALAAKTESYVEAARALGASDARIIVRHVAPTAIAPVTVQIGASFAVAIVVEATLSFLGLGTQAPNPSWGVMLNDARDYITDAPWLVFFPAATISVTVLSVNFLADGLRDALDPHYRNE